MRPAGQDTEHWGRIMTASRFIELDRQTPNGDALHASRTRAIPGGVNSNVRLVAFPTPLTFVRGQGSRIWDVDGNEYVDYAMGMGPHILGHNPAPVWDAISTQGAHGQLFAGQTEAEGELADALVAEIPWIDEVRFGLSGTEMDLLAIRVARAATGRQKIVRFEGHYHGWLDPLLISGWDSESSRPQISSGQSLASASDILVAPWNDLEALSLIVRAQFADIAAIVMEPIMCNTGLIEPAPGYLQGVKALCEELGIILVVDEVITGFRVGLQGAQGLSGVHGDLTIYAKGIASGYPIAVLGGRRDLMQSISLAGVNHSGTYNTGVIQVVAALATIRHLIQSDPYPGLYQSGSQLRDAINQLASERGADLVCEGPGPMLQIRFGQNSAPTDARSFARLSDPARLADLIAKLQRRGVRLTSRGLLFLSTAHSSEDLQITAEAFAASL